MTFTTTTTVWKAKSDDQNYSIHRHIHLFGMGYTSEYIMVLLGWDGDGGWGMGGVFVH